MNNEQRIYVGNIPVGVTEDNIKEQFASFRISSVEIKRKKTDNAENVFAYINVPVKCANKVIRKMNRLEWNGHCLNVELAKESFLERLKRERENNEARVISDQNHENNEPSNNNSNAIDRRRYDSRVELLNVRNSANGEDANDTNDVEDNEILHKIQKKQKSDMQRVQAIKVKKDFLEKKRKQVDNALKNNNDYARLNKKIRFDEDEYDDENIQSTQNQSKLKLFDDSDKECDNENDLDINFHLKDLDKIDKTTRIIRVNASSAGDDRFRLDRRFLDDEENSGKQNENEEKQKQLSILAEIAGPIIQQQQKRNDEHRVSRTFVRYDPALAEHAMYVKDPSSTKPTGVSSKKQKTKRQKRQQQQSAQETDATNGIETSEIGASKKNSSMNEDNSKETVKFSVTADSAKLKEILKDGGNEETSKFSLRSIFDQSRHKPDNLKLNDDIEECTTDSNPASRVFKLLPSNFNDADDYSSSDDNSKGATVQIDSAMISSNKTEHEEFGWMEKLFIQEDDHRLLEADKLFTNEINEEEIKETRLALKSLLKPGKSNDANERQQRPKFSVSKPARKSFFSRKNKRGRPRS